jgi:acyl-CoA synthetase (NDP forming)
VFEALLNSGYKVYPVNLKYASVNEHPCYPSVQALPEMPEVFVTATPPAVTEKVAETWSEKSVEICNTHGIQEIHDLCLVFALKSLK